jgi:RNA 3'-terminal phosphate cyclase (ATP)
MIKIDGSTLSGSGTLIRYAVALATLKREPIHMINIRAKRPKPGLRPQHLVAVKACSVFSGGTVEGAVADSREIVYFPGKTLKGGDFHLDIGTAGSATMLAFTLIAPALFADTPSRFTIVGGLFQDFAPSFFHMQKVLVPLIKRMGADVNLIMEKPGYVPKGRGVMIAEVDPLKSSLKPLHMTHPGKVTEIGGVALASHLSDRRVGRRMADSCNRALRTRFENCHIEVMEDSTAVQRGAALAVWARSEADCILGADQAGKPGRRSEAIADFVTRSLVEDLGSGACADRHAADQLILFAALADGKTEYTIPRVTEHVQANIWLVEKILGARAEVKGRKLKIRGIAHKRQRDEDNPQVSLS